MLCILGFYENTDVVGKRDVLCILGFLVYRCGCKHFCIILSTGNVWIFLEMERVADVIFYLIGSRVEIYGQFGGVG